MPLAKPLSACRVAMVSSAGLARHDQRPVDQELERRDPWWCDQSWRPIPLGTTEDDVGISNLHIDPSSALLDLDCVLPLRRPQELSADGIVPGRSRSQAPNVMPMRDDDAGEEPELPAALPTTPASAGALVRGRKDRLLILKPTYKGGWTIPGGVVEIGESPWEACRRETKEECGLDVTAGRLVCVDFLRPRPGRPGGMRFLFDCGVFDDAVLGTVVIQPEEIAECQILPLEKALPLLSGPIRRRVRAACESRHVRYLEDGRPVDGIRP